MNDKRNRNERLNLRVTQEEKQLIEAAREITGSNSIADLIINLLENSSVLLVNEIETYSDVFAKSGTLGKNIIKGLNLIQSQPDRYQAFINYLEKDDKKNFAALLAFASNLEKATNTYCLYEDNVKASADFTLKEFIKNKKRGGK
ncbi:type II toxin-antitoxin system TacA family antitoxin [Metapseudomonas otitidis]|uniref:hypothetical protein n=1 Tax=Metapseudomonas otitidis TaxID=319939 RepID=UPI00209AB3E5|nr:hypothetical protein [Pseudomonas otitidis]MCO7557146.1 hypothetical protein [Pseudomonas otitidis]